MSVPRNVQHLTQSDARHPLPPRRSTRAVSHAAVWKPLIAKHLRALAPGDVLEIRSDREEAADGISAWVRLTGNTLVTVERDQASRHARYFVRKKTPQT